MSSWNTPYMAGHQFNRAKFNQRKCIKYYNQTNSEWIPSHNDVQFLWYWMFKYSALLQCITMYILHNLFRESNCHININKVMKIWDFLVISILNWHFVVKPYLGEKLITKIGLHTNHTYPPSQTFKSLTDNLTKTLKPTN